MALDVDGKRRSSVSACSPRSDDPDCTSSSADSRVDESPTPPLLAPPPHRLLPANNGAPFGRHPLKFSIEKILSPEFGNGKAAPKGLRTHNGHHALPPHALPMRTVPTSPTDFFSAVAGTTNGHRVAPRPRPLPLPQPESPNSSNSSSTRPPRSLHGGGGGASTPEASQSPKLPALGPNTTGGEEGDASGKKGPILWPAWVYCTRYSDRPSSGPGPRSRRMKKSKEKKPDEKRPRTAFTAEQLARLKQEFQENRYLTEKRRQDLAKDLKLNESQIKIWFQNKRAKIKKASGQRNPLALQLMAQGLYNHSTVAMDGEGDDNDDDSMDKS